MRCLESQGQEALKQKYVFQKAEPLPQEAESSLFVLKHNHRAASKSEKKKKIAEFHQGTKAPLLAQLQEELSGGSAELGPPPPALRGQVLSAKQGAHALGFT